MLQYTLFGNPLPAPTRKLRGKTDAQKLREALEPYLDLRGLQQLAQAGGNIREALTTPGETSVEVTALLDAVAAVLQPSEREQIKEPKSLAALLMAQMGHLDQEEFRVACLDTKNRVQSIVTVYRGTVDSANIRICEAFKAAVRLNSTSVIFVHNHPSGEVTPSSQDVAITKTLVAAGESLDIPVLDHIIVGQGNWMSLRERGLGFSK